MNNQSRPLVSQYHLSEEGPYKGYYRVLLLKQRRSGNWDALCLSASDCFLLPVSEVMQHRSVRPVPFDEWNKKSSDK